MNGSALASARQAIFESGGDRRSAAPWGRNNARKPSTLASTEGGGTPYGASHHARPDGRNHGLSADEKALAVALGGTSLFGGVATIIGTVVGVFIPAVLQNGFIIVGLQPYWQMIAVGFVLILAVWFDRVRRSRGGR